MNAIAAPMPGRRPWDGLRLALGAAVLCCVWRVQDLFPGLAPLKLPTLMLLVLIGWIVISPREQVRAAVVSRRNVMRGLFAITALGLLSIPTSLYVGLSIEFMIKNVIPSVILALAAAAAVYTVADARRVAAIQVVGAVLYAAFILARFEVEEGGRLGSLVYYDANDLGMLMVCMLPVALYFVGHAARMWQRVGAIVAIALFLATIVKTGSRGALLALIAVILYMLLRYSTVNVMHRVATVGGIVILFIASTGAQYWDTVSTLLNPRQDYNWIGNTDGGRMAIWQRGLGYMADRPLTGVGLAAFPTAEGTISPIAERQMFGRGVKWSAAHNSFVQVGAELGVLGLLVFTAMVFGAWLMAGRLARDAQARGELGLAAFARAQAAGMVGYIVAGFFLSQAYAPFLFVSLGLIVGLDVAARLSWRAAALRTAA
jgi:O-antigen ligase